MRPAMEEHPVAPQRLRQNSLAQILARVVEEVKESISRDINGAELLYTLLNAPWLQSLLKVYECLQHYLRTSPRPYLPYASRLSMQIQADLSVGGYSPEARALFGLLRDPHLQALLLAHDMVAQKDYNPVLPPLPDDLPDEEEAMRIVCLVKNNQPLGATIRRDEATGEIFVARVIHGGLADRSGLLHAGDRLVEVNGHPVFGLEPEQIIQILAHCHGTIMFKVVPMTERPVNNQTMLYVRVMVDYSPEQDPTIPCVDAGVAFSKGDVLEIVDQTDALWWQAKKLPSTSACAGLIPSTNFLKRKQREMLWFQAYQPHTCLKALSTVDEEEDLIAIDEKCVETDEETFESEELREDEGDFSSNNSGVYMAGFRRSLRLSRRPGTQIAGTPHCPTNCCWDALETPYEEVVRYLRHPNDTHRVIALVGPSGVGVNELRKRLIEMNPQVYMGAVPHTTRPSRSHEESGREYHFISRELFENMAYNNRFVDYGEYRGHLYGTSMDAIKTVQDSGKICIIDIEPHAILSVRTHELRAYVIYIKPPVAECMRQTRKKSQITTNYYTSRYFKDEEYQEMEEVSKKIESQYCQFFDFVIVNNILQDARDQLLTAVKRAQEEPQWVPAAWIRPSAQN
ncbi:MAGUK p55 subfamily member 4 isoform X2 [Denticeps clupeoides]|nr:MAGUK p55 subfamily member 4 isoform X2 [Denticeps clupeoides]